jgi:putative DNA methylase
VRSFWLSKKKGEEAYVQPVVDKVKGTYEFKVRVGKPTDGFDPGKGTKLSRGASFQCLISGTSMEKSYIRGEFQAHRNSDTLLAIVCEGAGKRIYLSPIKEHENIARIPIPDDVPQETMPTDCKDLVSGRGYGITRWSELFTPRQLTALTTFSDLVKEAREKVLNDAKKANILPDDDRPLNDGGTCPQAYADAVATYLAFALNGTGAVW